MNERADVEKQVTIARNERQMGFKMMDPQRGKGDGIAVDGKFFTFFCTSIASNLIIVSISLKVQSSPTTSKNGKDWLACET